MPVPESALRVGRIAYTNVAPIETAFDCGAVTREAIVTRAAPTVLNAMLSAGDLDVSPISAAHYLRNLDAFELFGDCAIVARGRVISVVLASARPPGSLDGASIAVTGDSATARALLECVLRVRYGVRATFERVEDPSAHARTGRPTLLIGDAAIAIHDELPAEAIYDLGTAWFDWTGLPMVFAVWAVRRSVARSRPAEIRRLAAAYAESRAWGNLHRNAVIDAAMGARPHSRAFFDRYFSTLRYSLGADARDGLARFATEIASLETSHVAC